MNKLEKLVSRINNAGYLGVPKNQLDRIEIEYLRSMHGLSVVSGDQHYWVSTVEGRFYVYESGKY